MPSFTLFPVPRMLFILPPEVLQEVHQLPPEEHRAFLTALMRQVEHQKYAGAIVQALAYRIDWDDWVISVLHPSLPLWERETTPPTQEWTVTKADIAAAREAS